MYFILEAINYYYYIFKKKIIMGNFGKRPKLLKGLGTLP